MKTYYLLYFILFTTSTICAQNVGIGTNNPEELLHLQNGNIRLESTLLNGIEFFQRGNLKTGIYYNPLRDELNFTKNSNSNGLIFKPQSGQLLLGRNFPIGAEVFGIRSNSTSYGGMYIETLGTTGKPFLGYATDSIGRMWHYYDGLSESWRLYNKGERLAVLSNGHIGINTIDPKVLMHINGNEWDLQSTDGVLMLGSATNRMAFGIAVDGAGAGTGRIYSKGTNNRLILGGGDKDVLSVTGTEGRVGIGTNDPSYTLDINTEESRGLNINNNYSGASSKYGARIESSSLGSGPRYGIYASAYGNSASNGNIYGGRFLANPNSANTDAYGVYSQVSATGQGNKYALYTVASTSQPSTNAYSWSIYSVGNSYFSNEVRIGNLAGVSGYRLSVDGKIIGEELMVRMSDNWPDYVFDESYGLMSLEDVDQFINQNKHLPGIPSASEVHAEGGIQVGETNRLLLEKIEELTLYLIEQNKRIRQLEDSMIKKNSK
ncbi:hypothetical protein [Portibacter marinus]|uniref:hypothetical protein n=1 Tax=Portibacter marinus TaxID=2898660 RepID=UPI001F25CDFF|nr:hypothetical protein [Portibacter marinus]